jgi:hypothetical protein
VSLLRAVLRPEPFAVRVDGNLYAYRAMPALPWLVAITEDLWVTAVFPGLLPDDVYREHVLDGIQHGALPMTAVKRACFDAIGQAGGRKWWETYNLCSIAQADHTGSLLGRMVTSGVDPERVTLAGWCSALYSLLSEGADAKSRMRIDAAVSTPPPIAEAFDDAADDSFAAMVAAARMA